MPDFGNKYNFWCMTSMIPFFFYSPVSTALVLSFSRSISVRVHPCAPPWLWFKKLKPKKSFKLLSVVLKGEQESLKSLMIHLQLGKWDHREFKQHRALRSLCLSSLCCSVRFCLFAHPKYSWCAVCGLQGIMLQ